MRSIYIAAPWANREIAKGVRVELVSLGHLVTSRWLDVPDTGQLPSDRELCLREAKTDVEDIALADTLLVLTDPRPIGVGHHVEFGIALAAGKRIILAGPVKSVFHHMADAIYADWEDAKGHI